jgi:hypothetical protein
MTLVSVADVLEEAACLIERHGWVQRSIIRRDPATYKVIGICAAGGCVVAVNQLVDGYQGVKSSLSGSSASARLLYQAAWDRLAAATGMQVPSWNDASDRTKDEVIDTLRHVAKDLRNNATPGEA